MSLKNNSVLIALSEGRLPDERPNYEYFAQILALNEQVQVRPKRCWIFVSHQDVVVGKDGAGYIPATGDRLGEGDYPHLTRNLDREMWAKEEQHIFRGALLHEFTKEIHQVESSSVRELSKKWETTFPELHQRLKAITSTTTDAQCDILHMHVTLELREKRRFPSRSELNSWVEISIEQPRLLNHRWKVDTQLVRPAELSCSQDDSAPELLYETSDEIVIHYQHRLGCEGRNSRGPCDCISQRCRRDRVTVPFPADVWALTLTNCAQYPAHPYSDSKRHDEEEEYYARTSSDGDEKPRARRRTRQPTQMDLVPKIAMMQEIWSCPPAPPHQNDSSSSSNQRWTRRALLLWTFETIHSIDEGKLITAQGGRTNWRFLTILDPASEYHQRHAIVSGRRASPGEHAECPTTLGATSRPITRDVVMSPSPTYQQQLNASMSENFSSAWDSPGGLGPLSKTPTQVSYGTHLLPQTAPSQAPAIQAPYGLLESFGSHSGLATPPPSASLASSFSRTFDTASTGADLMPSYMATHVTGTTAGLAIDSHALGGTLSAVTDPLLGHVGTPYDETQNSTPRWNGPGVSSSMEPSAAWPAGYTGANGAMSWAESQSRPAPSPGNSEQARTSLGVGQHQAHPHHRQKGPRHERQQWTAAADATADEHGLWNPAAASSTTVSRPVSRHEQRSDTSSNATSASVKALDASQDWEQVHAPSMVSGVSDPSQGWEEAAALPEAEHPCSSSPLPVGDAVTEPIAHGVVDHREIAAPAIRGGTPGGTGDCAYGSSLQQGQARGFKRGRSDCFDDDGDDAERKGVCRRRRSRS